MLPDQPSAYGTTPEAARRYRSPYAHNADTCSICLGVGVGNSGYRPHTMTSECWCITNHKDRRCYLVKFWGMEAKEDAGT